MKLTKFTTVVALGLVLTFAATGCRKKPGTITPLPGSRLRAPGPSDLGEGTPIRPGSPTEGGAVPSTELPGGTSPGATAIPANPAGSHQGWPEDAEALKAYTVYFDYDKSAVRTAERSKVTSVADYLRSHAGTAVRVEGHCDERGTEEYNRALGERRANAAREELVRLGIEAGRVDTISYGKDRPADPGHTEAAHAKNRRAEFILLTPPAAP